LEKRGISMDKIREIIRLSQELNLGCRKISKALNISKTAVNDYIAEFRATGLNYQDIKDLTDSKLSEILSKNKRGCQKYKDLEAIFPYFAKELKRKGVTLKLLWDEYIASRWIQLPQANLALPCVETGRKDNHAYGT
jgi:predicted transcriptional regulator